MSYDWRQAVAALDAFQKEHKELKDFPWENASGVGEGTLRRFRRGSNRSMGNETYEKLAAGAAEILKRPVKAGELRGEARRLLPVRSRIGAGGQVYILDGDATIDYVEALPGVESTEALQVDGDSMTPLYNSRDILFPRPPTRTPSELVGRIVAAQLKDGRRVVKKLARGSRRGRYTLVSVNEQYPDIVDCEIETVALIGAAIYRE